jgi:phage terminase large subunit-like protein
LNFYKPYTRQKEFHSAGKEHNERLFMAGNRLGKTYCGSNEWAMHLTGRYPGWWKGRVFNKPVRFWAAGVTTISTRDTVQRLLIGPPAEEELYGTGAIPNDCLVDFTRARTQPHALDSVSVKHESGGNSYLGFKSYEMGRAKWQGETLDGIWFDEEPPMDIYSEGLTRTAVAGLFSMLTFTPLMGMSDVVMAFLSEEDLKGMV